MRRLQHFTLSQQSAMGIASGVEPHFLVGYFWDVLVGVEIHVHDGILGFMGGSHDNRRNRVNMMRLRTKVLRHSVWNDKSDHIG